MSTEVNVKLFVQHFDHFARRLSKSVLKRVQDGACGWSRKPSVLKSKEG
jgi:hypothetical protein